MIKDKLTVMVTIRNRRNTLPRIMNYYKDFPCDVIYLDSTPNRAFEDNDAITDPHEYRHVPGKNYCQKIYECCKTIKTKYSVIVCDDDFLSSTCLEDCVKHLENHPLCVACRGQEVSFPNHFLSLETLDYFSEVMFPFVSDCPKERAEYAWSHFNGASVHGIIENDIQKNIFKFVLDNPQFNAIRFFDKMHALLVAVHGNTAVLPVFFSVRGDELRAPSMKNYGHLISNWKPELNFNTDFIKNPDVDLGPIQDILGVNREFIVKIYKELISGTKKEEKIEKLFGYDILPPEDKCLCSKSLDMIQSDGAGNYKILSEYGCKSVLLTINNEKYELTLRLGVGGDYHGDDKKYQKWQWTEDKKYLDPDLKLSLLYPTLSEENIKQLSKIMDFVERFPL